MSTASNGQNERPFSIDDITDADREHLKDMIRNLIEQIELTPDYRCTIRYRMAIDGRNKMASPRGFEPLLPP